MSLDTGRFKLFTALKTLQVHWDQTSMVWQDGVRREFVEHHFIHLEPGVHAALAAMDRLGQVLNRVKQECSDRDA
jgi:hypothetical protein